MLLVYSLNARSSQNFQELDISNDAKLAARDIVAAGGGQIPNSLEFSVKLYRQGQNAIYTVDWMSVTPVMISALVADKTEEELIWIRLLKLVPVESGLHKMNPEPPPQIPWLARVLLPKHVYASKHLAWLTEVNTAMGFALLDGSTVAKEVGK